jgi:hypothetical protein
MPIEVKRTRGLAEEEKNLFFGTGENPFSIPGVDLRFQPADLHLVGYADGRPVCHAGIFKHVVNAGGGRICIGGIGGLITISKVRKHGHARELLEYAQRMMCDELGVCFGMLFCIEALVPFYERIGWRVLEEKVFVDQPAGKTEMPLTTMVWPCRRQDWPPGSVDVGRLPW